MTNYVKWHRLRQRDGHQSFTYGLLVFLFNLRKCLNGFLSMQTANYFLIVDQSFSGYLPRDSKSKFQFQRRTTRNWTFGRIFRFLVQTMEDLKYHLNFILHIERVLSGRFHLEGGKQTKIWFLNNFSFPTHSKSLFMVYMDQLQCKRTNRWLQIILLSISDPCNRADKWIPKHSFELQIRSTFLLNRIIGSRDEKKTLRLQFNFQMKWPL